MSREGFVSALRSAPPRVTVIIPAFNAERFVADAIRSAHVQTFACVAVIVVDDGSTDRTASIAASFPGVSLIRQPNAGVSAARNRGLAESRSEYVVFLDADDRLLPSAVDPGVSMLDQRPELGLVYGRHETIDAAGELLAGSQSPLIERTDFLSILGGNPFVPPGSAVFRRSVLERVGGFDPRLAMAEDLDLYLRVSLAAPIACHNRVVVQFRSHGANVSHQSAMRTLEGIYAAMRMRVPDVIGHPDREAAYAAGRLHWARLFGPRLPRDAARSLKHGRPVAAAKTLLTYLSLSARGIVGTYRSVGPSKTLQS
jgi:glycosyltransferase involved in cell wall biosynthesis